MPMKDMLLPLVGEPDAAAIAAIDKCMAVAGDIGTKVTAMAIEEDISVWPRVTISGDLDNTAAAKARQSVSDAHGPLKAFDAAAIRFSYHHSRMNEIVWGGATKTVIGRPPCWVMMSR